MTAAPLLFTVPFVGSPSGWGWQRPPLIAGWEPSTHSRWAGHVVVGRLGSQATRCREGVGTLALHLSWLAVPDCVFSERLQNMSRGFSESCVPFQGVIEPGERGRGPPAGNASDLGTPFCGWRLIWGSLVGPHASFSELECWTLRGVGELALGVEMPTSVA